MTGELNKQRSSRGEPQAWTEKSQHYYGEGLACTLILSPPCPSGPTLPTPVLASELHCTDLPPLVLTHSNTSWTLGPQHSFPWK